MGKNDSLTKKLLQDPDRFADLANYILYDGEQKIQAQNLVERDPTELIIVPKQIEDVITKQKVRDVLKGWIVKETKDALIALIGIENQSDIHYAMPVKNLLYDALDYASQVEEISKLHRESNDKMSGSEFLSGFTKSDKLIPVITIVVYFGCEKWNGPTSLHEMLATKDKQLTRFIPDYKIALVDPHDVTDFEKFRSDIQWIMRLGNANEDKEKMQRLIDEYGDYLSNLDKEVGQVIKESYGIPISFSKKKEGEADMCKAIDEMREDAKKEAVLQERKTMIARKLRKGFTPEKIHEDDEFPMELIQEVQSEMTVCM